MTTRQKKYLKLIVDSYIGDGVPVASVHLLKKYNLDVSSATVRNEMNILEKNGFLEKSHTSSGRIPTTIGYEYYAKHIKDKSNIRLKQKLEDIFARRNVSIDFTLEEAANAISNLAGLTLVTTSSEINELLKSIQLTPLNETAATIVLVTSSGRVESKLIEFNNMVKINDVRIAIRLFKERLVDSPLRELSARVDALAPILAQSVKNYEALIKAFINKVFDFHNRITNKVYGNNELIKKEGIKREDLANLVNMIEHKSIWSSIEGKLDEDETMKIEIRPNNTSFISKKIEYGNISKEVSIVGSNRMNYSEAKQILKFLAHLLGEQNDK